MKWSTLVLVLCVVVLVVFFGYKIIVDHSKYKEEVRYDFDVTVVAPGQIGFNVDRDKIHFGNVCQGCGSSRKLMFTNSHSYRERVEFWIVSFDNPEVVDWIGFNPLPGSMLKAGEAKNFSVRMEVPDKATLGDKKGMIIIQTYKAWFWEKGTEAINFTKKSKALNSSEAFGINVSDSNHTVSDMS